MSEFRIEYSIQRAASNGDFVEIGFGSSGTWDSIDAAMYAIETDIQRRSWETKPGMSDPDSVDERMAATSRGDDEEVGTS